MRNALDHLGQGCLARQQDVAFGAGDIGIGRVDRNIVCGRRCSDGGNTWFLGDGRTGSAAIGWDTTGSAGYLLTGRRRTRPAYRGRIEGPWPLIRLGHALLLTNFVVDVIDIAGARRYDHIGVRAGHRGPLLGITVDHVALCVDVVFHDVVDHAVGIEQRAIASQFGIARGNQLQIITTRDRIGQQLGLLLGQRLWHRLRLYRWLCISRCQRLVLTVTAGHCGFGWLNACRQGLGRHCRRRRHARCRRALGRRGSWRGLWCRRPDRGLGHLGGCGACGRLGICQRHAVGYGFGRAGRRRGFGLRHRALYRFC